MARYDSMVRKPDGTRPGQVWEDAQIKNDIKTVPLTADQLAESAARAADAALWETTPPDYKTEGRFYRNQSLRMLRGISRDAIEKATVRDRVLAARSLQEMSQLCLDRPTANISFADRRHIAEVLPSLLAEIERRKREAATIDGEAVDVTQEED